MNGITIDTVGDIRGSHDIHAFCNDCGHWARVDLTRLGPSLKLHTLYQRLACALCRCRDVSVRLVYAANTAPPAIGERAGGTP